MRHERLSTVGNCLLLLLAACGGSDAAPPAEAETGSAESTSGGEQEAPPAADVPWDQRTTRQKAQFMNDVVVPTMKPLFQAFDGQEFARFGCPTCHGANAREVQFRMPNTLFPLSPAAMPRPESADADEARWATFMMQQVVPKMSELIGEQPFDPATGQGFGCFNCHARR